MNYKKLNILNSFYKNSLQHTTKPIEKTEKSSLSYSDGKFLPENNNVLKFSVREYTAKPTPLNKSSISGEGESDLKSNLFTTGNNIKRTNKLITTKSEKSLIDSEFKQNKSKIKSNLNYTENTATVKRKTNTAKMTSTAIKNSSYQEQEWAVSIIENYAREVGISAYNFKTSEIFVTQFIDNEAYVNSITMINYWKPLEIILNQKSEDSLFHMLIKKFFNNTYIGFLPRKNFSEDLGKEIYLQSCMRELSLDEINTKYVCMASLAGLFSYLETNSSIKLSKDNLIIRYHYLENHLNISFQSILDLELLLNNKFNKTFGSFISLFRCQTTSGMRLLRSTILQPLAVKQDLNKRYEALEELLNNYELILYLKEFLPYFKDLENYISKFFLKLEEPSESQVIQMLNSINGIKSAIKALINFREILKSKFKSEYFVAISKSFDDKSYDYILEKIEFLIEDYELSNAKISRKQDNVLFIIKPGINNILDVSRKTYSDTVNEILLEFEKLKTSTNDPQIKLQYSQAKGYYIIIGENYFNQEDFVVSRKIYKKIHCANIPLVSLSERIKEIKRDLIDISMNLIVDLVNVIKKNINYLYILSSYIAIIDLLCAYAEFSKLTGNCVKPTISNNKNYPYIFAKNLRNPIHELNRESYEFVPNDYLLVSHFNVLILKGANASGKTTYMKGLALATILAQIGCFVPCDYFELSLRKFLYTKFGSNDSVEENKGTYIKEIIEMQKVISNNLIDSLILLDEPFDNSDSKENFALSIAVLEQFTNQMTNSFIIISSHNNSLTQLSSFYFNIIIGKMNVEFTEQSLNFLFKFKFETIQQNKNTKNIEESYGIILANMLGLDNSIINKAKEISQNYKRDNIKENIRSSEVVDLFKYFIFKFLRSIYELKYVSKCYLIEEEINLKINEIKDLINNCIN